jgi:hypothetical protein
MSEINYFKTLYYARWCWPIACEWYKLVEDVTIDNVDSLHKGNYIKWLIMDYLYISIVVDKNNSIQVI